MGRGGRTRAAGDRTSIDPSPVPSKRRPQIRREKLGDGPFSGSYGLVKVGASSGPLMNRAGESAPEPIRRVFDSVYRRTGDLPHSMTSAGPKLRITRTLGR